MNLPIAVILSTFVPLHDQFKLVAVSRFTRASSPFGDQARTALYGFARSGYTAGEFSARQRIAGAIGLLSPGPNFSSSIMVLLRDIWRKVFGWDSEGVKLS